ncbi:hypothetical protein QE152_g29067 [Popillia japonica]|uniref:Uncharacterized protein n=1 Tax=Popillia japonica TaxID=7064 RepID=A0AAW1JJG7_POPJA
MKEGLQKNGPSGAIYKCSKSGWITEGRITDIAELFKNAFNRVATIEKGVRAVQVTGIFPFNRFVFSDEELTPLTHGVERITAENANPTIQRIERTLSPVAGPSTSICRSLPKVSQTKRKRNRESSSDSDISDLVLEEVTEDELSDDNDKTLQLKQANKSFTALLPLPKSKIKGMSRRTQHSKIMTSTPVKDELEKKEERKKARPQNVKRREKEKK